METTLTFPQEDPGPDNMEPFVGTGADPGFNSNSAPTNPNYWPFRQHLRSRCSLTRSSNRGLQDTGVYNQRKCKVIPKQQHKQSRYSLPLLSLLRESYISDLTQQCNNNITDGQITQHQPQRTTRYTWFTLSLGLRPQNCVS
jgi:hypothetical protein